MVVLVPHGRLPRLRTATTGVLLPRSSYVLRSIAELMMDLYRPQFSNNDRADWTNREGSRFEK